MAEYVIPFAPHVIGGPCKYCLHPVQNHYPGDGITTLFCGGSPTCLCRVYTSDDAQEVDYQIFWENPVSLHVVSDSLCVCTHSLKKHQSKNTYGTYCRGSVCLCQVYRPLDPLCVRDYGSDKALRRHQGFSLARKILGV